MAPPSIPAFKVKLNGPRMRQWRTASLKLVKDARLEEHLGKPTWAAEVRRWAKEFDREAVLSAESNQHTTSSPVDGAATSTTSWPIVHGRPSPSWHGRSVLLSPPARSLSSSGKEMAPRSSR